METAVFTDKAEVVPMTDDRIGSGIVLFTEGKVTSEESVAAMFSDPVEVEFVGENNGTVTYSHGDGEVSEYPFVLIPEEGEVDVTPETR
jgi:hypothetical protein